MTLGIQVRELFTEGKQRTVKSVVHTVSTGTLTPIIIVRIATLLHCISDREPSQFVNTTEPACASTKTPLGRTHRCHLKVLVGIAQIFVLLSVELHTVELTVV